MLSRKSVVELIVAARLIHIKIESNALSHGMVLLLLLISVLTRPCGLLRQRLLDVTQTCCTRQVTEQMSMLQYAAQHGLEAKAC